MRRVSPLFPVLLSLWLPAMGCGPDKAERGLAPANENATPESKGAMSETEQQRQQKLIDDMQKQEDKKFDADADKKAP